MTLFQFGVDVVPAPTGAHLAVLFERCDDLAVEHDRSLRRTRVRFDRTTPSLADAMVSGVRDLDHAGLEVLRVVADDDLITGAAVAARLGRGWPATERLLRDGPPPVWRCADEPLYRWTEVQPWLRSRGELQPAGAPADDDAAREAVNLALRLRSLAARVDRMALIRSLIPR